MFKLFLLALCLSAVYGHHDLAKLKSKFPLYAKAKLFGHVFDDVTQNFSTICGFVDFLQTDIDVPIQVNVSLIVKPAFSGMGEMHGLHIHEFGTQWSKNTTKKCAATGAHFNPKNTTHGWRSATIRHVGDLGNVPYSAETGLISTNFTDKLIHLHGFESIIGRSVVLHLNKDDGGLEKTEMSLATGTSGPRIACGDIVWAVKDY
jgi:Cu-Zn family superoxide dismutase